ncbi:molybdate ABC transporter substrate-binding protein [Salinicoccus sp. ID82-1]|uniref:Molybdate ABC transporter substrate-binding protein n=1 Tax=Salinicoccus cyprini TaxID=2493691 RepID=A0A558AUV3_9STAP|nr:MULTISPECIES: molybdate ABC transporter substrate-binding protein [Salinicoccus]MCG1010607.1 molybdate ABC transporter substrate-binding protein [Salinicoccus sp. ID82-1]TVT28028.1 molybdate ABC transporter substrate-binding protein [Salinicoccus cyprini]
MRRIMLACMLIFMMLAGCSSASGEAEQSLTVSAAASLGDAMDEIKTFYEEANPEVSLSLNFGGSGTLQKQISQGAPVDLFISAAEDRFQILLDEGRMDDSAHTELLGNSLVLIVPEGNEEIAMDELDHVDTLSIGTPSTVPAGMYAKEALKSLGQFETLEGNIVYAKDVRQVLSYVETGNVDAGIVYRTDAVGSEKATITEEISPSLHTQINYPAGVLKDSQNHEAAMDFYKFLQSEAALKVFEDHGFTTQ